MLTVLLPQAVCLANGSQHGASIANSKHQMGLKAQLLHCRPVKRLLELLLLLLHQRLLPLHLMLPLLRGHRRNRSASCAMGVHSAMLSFRAGSALCLVGSLITSRPDTDGLMPHSMNSCLVPCCIGQLDLKSQQKVAHACVKRLSECTCKHAGAA